ncbi:glycosyltransferase [uncultured Desulfovibrio sp.]|uniref:glycosyltransferase n=3 Tax=uncultured Desulfovibrio sp. TaxID=167968 RepID=UPI0025E3A9D8|nr:glycosyltransferase [uncultured Desulfovibrio sp.]
MAVDKRLTIAIGASSLCVGKGGTERVAIDLAHEMLARGHSVFILCYDHHRLPPFALDPRVAHIILPADFFRGSQKAIADVRTLLADRNTDVFLSLQSEATHLLWALCCLGTGIPFVCSERSDPRFTEAVSWNRPGRHAVLASADAIHELLDAHVPTVPEEWRSKVRVIPNAAPLHARAADTATTEGRPSILFLGRFIRGKRADVLLRAFALLAPRFPQWTLQLIGHGPENTTLERLARRLGMADRVEIRASREDVAEDYARASIYCLPTRVEGFPNTVVEAMAAGLPVVGIADCPAMTSLVRPGENGALAADASPAGVAEALRPLMASVQLRQSMGQKSRELCSSLYDRQQIFDQWERLFYELTSHKGRTVMDGFTHEPFASMARLSSAARREWLYRNFGDPMPYSYEWWKERATWLWRSLRGKRDQLKN